MSDLFDFLIEYFQVDGVFLSLLMDFMPSSQGLTNELSVIGLPHAALCLSVLLLVFVTHWALQRSFDRKLNLPRDMLGV